MALPKLALFFALSAPLLLSPAYAQHGGGGHGGGGGHAAGGFHGGVGGGFRGGVGVGGGFRGGFIGGRGFYGGRFYGPGLYFGVGGWGYPYYYGYPYYGGYAYGPSYGYGYDPYGYDPGYSAPPPNVPQTYGYPGPQGQGQPAPPQQPQTQPQSSTGEGQYYLIAFKDHTIQAATAYKVDGDQFHWITREGREMQVPLSRVDIAYSQQLNRDRGVELQIP